MPQPSKLTVFVRRDFSQGDGMRRYPTSAVLFSVDKPSKGKPCLLSQFEVLSLLHETGHALHNLVSETQHGLLHGTEVARDFVEVQATVLEKLMTIPSLLRRMSCHYAHLSPELERAWREGSGELSKMPEREIPEELVVASLQKSKDFSLFRTYANLASSLFDMAIHNVQSHEEIEKMNLAETFDEYTRRLDCSTV